MASRGLSITIDGLEELGADLGNLAHPGLAHAIRDSLRGAGGEAIASEMRTRAPRRSGGLVSGIGVHGGTGGADVLVGYQGGSNQLGTWIESGTKPHEIRARDGGSLMFGGQQVEKVQHPGIRGQKVAAKSIRASEWEVLADVTDKINARVGGVG